MWSFFVALFCCNDLLLSSSLVTHPGAPSAVVCSPLAGPAEGGRAEEGSGTAAGLAGDAGEEEKG